MTQEELAGKLNVTRQALSNWERDVNEPDLNTLKNQGRVSASGHVYPGVRIVIRDTTEDVRMDCKATTFYLDKGIVRYGKYQEENEEDSKKVPSGYSTN